MDELFGNLIYLLPIALIIVRVISAAGNSAKKKPPSSPSARSSEVPRRAPEQDMDPAMREFLKNFGVEPPPVAASPAVPKQPRKRTAKQKPAPQKKEPAEAQPPLVDPDMPKQAERSGEPVRAGEAESRGVPKLPAGLSPLQQGFLWAEILGPAKAMRD
ncbi:MAG: hypothetical protein LBP29_01190 [Treponema sp.]|jgi:hypothetical protein|nr:hypothetical protein [Treponema sp.]